MVELKCFAERDNGKCGALNDCLGCFGECRFRKSVEQVAEEQKKCNARLASLPMMEQKRIAGNYYRGKRPWSDKKSPLQTGE